MYIDYAEILFNKRANYLLPFIRQFIVEKYRYTEDHLNEVWDRSCSKKYMFLRFVGQLNISRAFVYVFSRDVLEPYLYFSECDNLAKEFWEYYRTKTEPCVYNLFEDFSAAELDTISTSGS